MMNSWQGWVALRRLFVNSRQPKFNLLKSRKAKEENLWAMRKSENSKLPRNILSHKGHYVFILSSVLLIIIPLCRYHLFTIYGVHVDGLEERTSVLNFGKTRCADVRKFLLDCPHSNHWMKHIRHECHMFFRHYGSTWTTNNTSSWGMKTKCSICFWCVCMWEGTLPSLVSLFNFMSQNFVYVVSHFCGNEKSKRRRRIFHHNPSLIS